MRDKARGVSQNETSQEAWCCRRHALLVAIPQSLALSALLMGEGIPGSGGSLKWHSPCTHAGVDCLRLQAQAPAPSQWLKSDADHAGVDCLRLQAQGEE